MRHIYRLLYPLAQTYWFITRPRALGAGVILRRGDEILLVRHTYGRRHLWYVPGGGQKHGEDAVAAAKRELREEVGITVPLTAIGEITATEDYRYITATYFTGAITGEAPRKDRAEVAEMRWWPLSALPAPLSPLTRAALDLYQHTVQVS